jgi:lipoprotein-releasing system permease protein
MITPVELSLSLRYLRARTRNRFVSFITLASTAGIALGVATLITVISVMNGFSGELRDSLLSLSAHVTVRAADRGPLTDWEALRSTLASDPHAVAVTPYVEGEGMLVHAARLRPVQVEGVFLDDPVMRDRLGSRLVRGDLDGLVRRNDAVLVGVGLAALLGVDVGQRLNLLVPRVEAGVGRVRPVLTRLTIAGVFRAGVQEHDNGRVILGAAEAAAMFGKPVGAVDGLRVMLDDLMRAPGTVARWQDPVGPAVALTDWSTEQASYFRAVRMEKVMMFLILSLVVGVAAFNIVATLVMVVKDKRTDIAILRTMGLSPRSVTTVFVTQGVLIGLIGVVTGLAAGLALTSHLDTLLPWVESVFRIRLIPTDVYYLDHIPTDVRAREVAFIAISAFVLAALATVYPARRAANTPAADALRYE